MTFKKGNRILDDSLAELKIYNLFASTKAKQTDFDAQGIKRVLEIQLRKRELTRFSSSHAPRQARSVCVAIVQPLLDCCP